MTFSIIIPVYNVAPYLRECLDSVLAQTYTDWEAICVDDGSTDGSGAILDEYAAKDPRFKVIHQANAGVSAARNAALDIAQGEWVWFVDGDDEIHPKSLEFFTGKANEPIDAIRIRYVSGSCRPCSWDIDLSGPVRKFSSKNGRFLLGFFFAAWGYVIRRRTIGSVKFEPYKWSEDSLFMLSVAGNASYLIETDARMYFYRQVESSASHRVPSVADMERMFDCQQRIVDVVRAKCQDGTFHNADDFWRTCHSYVFYSYQGLMWTMSCSDRRKMISRWVSMQTQFKSLYRVPLEMRIRAFLVTVVRSGWLFPKIVCAQPRGIGRVRRMYSFVRGVLKRWYFER